MGHPGPCNAGIWAHGMRTAAIYVILALLLLTMVALATAVQGQDPVLAPSAQSQARLPARAKASVTIMAPGVRLENGRTVLPDPQKSRFHLNPPQRPKRRACPPRDAPAPGCILIIHEME